MKPCPLSIEGCMCNGEHNEEPIAPNADQPGLIYRCDFLGCESRASVVHVGRHGAQLYWCDDHIPTTLDPGEALSRLASPSPAAPDGDQPRETTDTRPEWIRCVSHSHVDLKNTSWCGRTVHHEWTFMDAEHAAENGRQNRRLVACPACVAAIYIALSSSAAPNGGGEEIVDALIARWSADPTLQVGVPYRRMASEAAEIIVQDRARLERELTEIRRGQLNAVTTALDDNERLERELEEAKQREVTALCNFAEFKQEVETELTATRDEKARLERELEQSKAINREIAGGADLARRLYGEECAEHDATRKRIAQLEAALDPERLERVATGLERIAGLRTVEPVPGPWQLQRDAEYLRALAVIAPAPKAEG